jgi:hypothetical protein
VHRLWKFKSLGANLRATLKISVLNTNDRKPLFLSPTSNVSGILARFCKLLELRSRPSVSMRR